MRRAVLAALAAATAALAPTAQALAWMDWCDSEPPLVVTTASGNRVAVNNFLSAPQSDRRLLEKASVFGYASPGEDGGSLIHIFVVLPGGGSQYVRIDSKAVRYDASTQGSGAWGSVVALEMSVPVS